MEGIDENTSSEIDIVRRQSKCQSETDFKLMIPRYLILRKLWNKFKKKANYYCMDRL